MGAPIYFLSRAPSNLVMPLQIVHLEAYTVNRSLYIPKLINCKTPHYHQKFSLARMAYYQRRNQTKSWGVAKFFGFKRATVFCLGHRLTKHKTTRYAGNLWGAWPPLATTTMLTIDIICWSSLLQWPTAYCSY